MTAPTAFRPPRTRRSLGIGSATLLAWVALAGCAALIGVDEDYQDISSNAATGGGASSASSAAQGGNAAAGGGGDGGGTGGDSCHDAPDPPGGDCPNLCSGGCQDGICLVSCDNRHACEDAIIECPDNFSCVINCSDYAACRRTVINCPDDYACKLTCSGTHPCDDLTLNCSATTPCHIDCQDGNSVCDEATVNCGAKACTAQCDDGGDAPSLSCVETEQSCFCNPCFL